MYNHLLILVFILVLSGIAWICLLVRTIYVSRNTVIVAPNSSSSINYTPFVSVLLAVRNEADRMLKESVRSLVIQNYPSYEVIAVDDCSTDRSYQILERLAKKYSHLTVIRGSEPPSGWIGKTYALEQGKRISRGEWLLAVDADVVFSPYAISAAMSVAMENGYDAITLLPRLDLFGFWEKAVLPVIAWLSIMRVPPTVASDPRSKHCFGFGNFILMRRYAHDKIGGYQRYYNEVLEDCWTMQLLKDNGYRVLAADGTKLLRSRMYRNLKEIVQGLAKNMFATTGFSIPRGVGIIMLYVLLVVLPLLSFVVGFVLYFSSTHYGDIILGLISLVSLVSLLFMICTGIVFNSRMRAPLSYVWLCWLGHLLSVGIFAMSMILTLSGHGVTWRGRRIAVPRP